MVKTFLYFMALYGLASDYTPAGARMIKELERTREITSKSFHKDPMTSELIQII